MVGPAMPRWWIALGLLAGVTTGDALAQTAASGQAAATSTTPSRRKVVSRASAGKATRPVKASKGAGSAKRAKRTKGKTAVTRANGNNMPRGFSWPPSQAMTEAEAACERALDAAAVAWTPASREGHIADALTIDDGMLGGVAYVPVYGKGPYKLDCQLALALHSIGPELRAAGVREVRFGSIYRWSNVRVGGKTKNALSRHALGLAMDVVSFVDESGREANVARDYPLGDALLLDIERALDASGWFRLVLTPSNDPLSHHDHFHMEANPRYAVPPRQKLSVR